MLPPAPLPNGKQNADYLKQFGGLNIGYVAELIEQTESSPARISTLTTAPPAPPTPNGTVASNAALPGQLHGLLSYIDAIREYGYRVADLDPLGMARRSEPFLDPAVNRVTADSLTVRTSSIVSLLEQPYLIGLGATAGSLVARLKETYCGTTGYEFSHVRSLVERSWLYEQVERGAHRIYLGDEQKRSLLELLTRSETFEQFLHRAYPGQRWYSLEGLESLIVVLEQIVLQSSHTETRNIVVGMAHRGRLNVIAHIFGKPYEEIISEFSEGHFTQLASLEASGWMTDVKYHLGARLERDVDGDGSADVRLHLLPNPSHLEMVDPVVVGAVRAMQDSGGPGQSTAEAMGVIVHGDASFAGQGIVSETFNLAQLAGYDTGGSIHIIANNQLGFTTEPEDSYSTEQSSDVARGFDIPIIHVNADDVEACVAVAKLAVAYRERFHKDVLIDLVGYRRFGHNENDEPAFTQPIMYRKIAEHPTVRAKWAAAVVSSEVITQPEAEEMQTRTMEMLLELKASVDDAGRDAAPSAPPDLGLSRNGSHGLEHAESHVDLASLKAINRKISTPPDAFTPHPTASRLLQRRQRALSGANTLDWGHAEALAIGSVLADGHDVRLTGQDVRRGTFSHRHAVLFDYETQRPWVTLEGQGPGKFSIYNSPLSEVAAVGFEHGYSVVSETGMVIWEAQFGDFVNNAQSIVDELIVSAGAKWGQSSGLVLLLPHGYEGQGPNHSHAHIERFLALAAKDNIRIAYPTTAGQYFHLLRSQAAMLREEPLPLVVMTGKSLLRHPLAAATAADLTAGSFEPVIRYEKPGVKPGRVRRLIMCTGKVYTDLLTSDRFETANDLSVIRVEELYPFPRERMEAELKKLPNVEEFIWLQEEPQNRGAWSFMAPRLRRLLPDSATLKYVGRPATPSPAEGSHWLHRLQQSHLVEVALGVAEPVSAFV
jgi:2-oxoglutarate dehydrogenase E1 component